MSDDRTSLHERAMEIALLNGDEKVLLKKVFDVMSRISEVHDEAIEAAIKSKDLKAEVAAFKARTDDIVTGTNDVLENYIKANQ